MRLYRRLCRNVAHLIDTYSNYNPSPMSLKKLTDFGKPVYQNQALKNNGDLVNKTEIKSYEFLREELLVRLAAMMKEMLYLPENLVKTSSVQQVYGWYMQSFTDIVEYKDIKKIDEGILKKFTKVLNTIVTRHSEVVPTIALGILQLQETYGIDAKTEQSIQYFLDRFLMSRISVRMLINQHVLMFGEENNTPAGHIGSIHPKCKILEVVQDAYDNAKFLCEQYYLCSPDVEIVEDNAIDKGKPIEFVYVPSHLYHIAFELFKNAMRAIIEHHGQTIRDYPKIKTLIVKGKEDVTVRITDFGGGIPKSKLPLVFKYMYSTAPRPSIVANVYSTSNSAPLAGFGYGLPLSRLYARYFNGDLVISSIDGHSTDAYIYLKTISSEANESLPISNRKSVNTYKSSGDATSDWTENRKN